LQNIAKGNIVEIAEADDEQTAHDKDADDRQQAKV